MNTYFFCFLSDLTFFQAETLNQKMTNSKKLKTCSYLANVIMPIIFVVFAVTYFLVGFINTLM